MYCFIIYILSLQSMRNSIWYQGSTQQVGKKSEGASKGVF